MHQASGEASRDALPLEFYERPADRVARDLLGCRLRRSWRGHVLEGRIVETEAYLGTTDRACHAHRGLTARTAVMFGGAGHAYVYFVYGMHSMLNVVCQPEGEPHAVLLRAVEPLTGVALLRRRRGVRRDADIASGPGKLCAAFAVTRALNGIRLDDRRLSILPGGLRAGERVARSPRIGVEYAGEDAARPLRYFIAGHPHVSRSRSAGTRRRAAHRR